MIDRASYELEWIRKVSASLGKKGDPKLLEKVIYAFTLLEQLVAHKLDFIFKGGTSLLLSTNSPRRFSIDIDIITSTPQKEIEALLEKIVATGLFIRWAPDNDRKSAVEAPVAHYKLYYKSKVDTHIPEEPILLDILFAANPYQKVKEYPIAHDWILTDKEPLTVNIPVFESLLGDKLTAFAPTTTGILYTKNRPVEIIKQLYDVGLLFDLSSDFELVKKSFLKVVHEEIAYRKLNITWKQVLQDTTETCHILAQRDQARQEFIHLQTGITNITNFILDRFKIEEAITASAKTAYLCSLLQADETGEPGRFESPTQLADLKIESTNHLKLNKLKKTNPEAFYYWHKSIELNAKLS
ncbi:MAG: nucleotidyl transferase AbiEii/AbiGii toxin family protein [Cyclobacteriaceae bacterium]